LAGRAAGHPGVGVRRVRPPVATDLPLMIEAAAQAAWSTDRGEPIAAAVVAALRDAGVILPAAAVIERAAIAGRARARKRAAGALLHGLTPAQMAAVEGLLAADPPIGMTRFAWLKAMPVAPKADHVGELLDRLHRARGIGLPPEAAGRVHEERLRQLVREGQTSDAYQLGRYAAHRRRAILVATVFDLEARLTDAVLDMADKLIGGLLAKARNAKRRRYAATAMNVSRLMRLFHGTIDALATAQAGDLDAFEAVDSAVGWAKLLRVRGEVQTLAELAGEDPLRRAADRWKTLRKFAPALIEALEFRAARANDPTVAALRLLADLNRSGKRDVPADAPMPFRKDWRRLVLETGKPNRRLYETAVLATLRDKLRSGDVWVERSSGYRRFDAYLLPQAVVPEAAATLGLPASADEWLAARGKELDRRLRCFAGRLRRGELEGVELRDERLHVAPVKASAPPEARAFADGIEAMMPAVRITEVLHDVSRATGLAQAFTNLRTGERCEDENALLAVVLADATNLGLDRMAAASHGVTRDKLIWTADAYIRSGTCQAALARIIDAHHALPVAATWGDGTTSASDRQFFRSGGRGDAAGEVNARYGPDPGLGFYTHVSDQHGPCSVRVMSATSHGWKRRFQPLCARRADAPRNSAADRDPPRRYRGQLGPRVHPVRDVGLPVLPAAARLPRPQARHLGAGVRLQGPCPAPGTPDQDRGHPRALGRDPALGRLLARRHRAALGDAQASGRLPAAESARLGTAGVGPHRAHALHVGLAGIAPAQAALPRRAEQERAAPRARPGRLHLQAGAHRRPWPGSAAVPRFGAEPGDRHHRLLELDLHRRRRRAHAR
jgi:hypothetical protein